MTEIATAQRALGMLGITTALPGADVADLGGDNKAEDQVTLWFTTVRDALFRSAPWGFATRNVTLTLDDTQDGTQTWWDQWTYSYEYPDDTLMVWCLLAPAGRLAPKVKWKKMQDDAGEVRIFTDMPDARACVVVNDATDPATWSAEFDLAMSSALAAYMAMPMTSDIKLQTQCIAIARGLVAEARIQAGLEAEPDNNKPCVFEYARRGINWIDG